MDHVEYVYTGGIEDADVERLLREHDHGVLSLARADEGYAVPLNYYWDGDRVILRLGDEEGSEKIEFADATTTATLVVYEATAPDEAWSVLVRGPLRRLSEAERAAVTDADINAEFPPFHLHDETVENVEIALYELTPDEITGRQTVE